MAYQVHTGLPLSGFGRRWDLLRRALAFFLTNVDIETYLAIREALAMCKKEVL